MRPDQARAAARCPMTRITSWVDAPGRNTSATPSCLSSGMSWLGMIPPTNSAHGVHPALAQQLHDAAADGHVGAGEDGQADDVGVLLRGGRHDLLGALAQAGVDDLHARVAQRARDHLGAAIVAVEARLRDDDPDATGGDLGHGRIDNRLLEDRLLPGTRPRPRAGRRTSRRPWRRRAPPRGSAASGCPSRGPRPCRPSSAPRRARVVAVAGAAPARAPPARPPPCSSM